jgi:acyl-CoA synthetase (AMP-forming)/AMP-acid ligase II
VLVRDIDPAKIAELIETHRITHGFLVPAVLQFMLMIPEARARDYTSLRYMLYGASPISTQVLADAVRTFGCNFMQAYGLTETTGTVVLLPPEDHDPDGPNAHRLRAAGKPIPGCDLKIVEPSTGEEVPVGDVGEIWVRTAQNMKGYWNLPEETAKSILPDGFFRTGDAGYLDAEGYVYIHDRVKDMIVSGGENIYPAEVENVLMSHPGVADCAVIGVPSEKWGETPKAMVVKAAGTDPDPAEIISYCRERLAHYKCPTSVDWVESIPRNPSGKVLKKDLRAPYWEGRERFVG